MMPSQLEATRESGTLTGEVTVMDINQTLAKKYVFGYQWYKNRPPQPLLMSSNYRRERLGSTCGCDHSGWENAQLGTRSGAAGPGSGRGLFPEVILHGCRNASRRLCHLELRISENASPTMKSFVRKGSTDVICNLIPFPTSTIRRLQLNGF